MYTAAAKKLRLCPHGEGTNGSSFASLLSCHCTEEKTGTRSSRHSGMGVEDTEFETPSWVSKPVARIVILFLPAPSALDIEPFGGSQDLTIEKQTRSTRAGSLWKIASLCVVSSA